MPEPTELTTFIIHDPKVQQAIVFARVANTILLVFSLIGIWVFWSEFVSILFYLLMVIGVAGIWATLTVRCAIDATTETLIVHQQRLWQHHTKTYPMTDLHDTVVQGHSLVFILVSGKRILIGPLTDVAATTQALWMFLDRAFPAEPPESTMGVSGK